MGRDGGEGAYFQRGRKREKGGDGTEREGREIPPKVRVSRIRLTGRL